VRRPSLVLGALLGGLSSLPLIALSFLGEQWGGLPFVPFDLFDWLVRVLPGNVITTGIDSMVRLITLFGLGPTSAVAKRLEQLQGILLVIAGGVMVGLLVAGACGAVADQVISSVLSWVALCFYSWPEQR
jgi:hypothetical protein